LSLFSLVVIVGSVTIWWQVLYRNSEESWKPWVHDKCAT